MHSFLNKIIYLFLKKLYQHQTFSNCAICIFHLKSMQFIVGSIKKEYSTSNFKWISLSCVNIYIALTQLLLLLMEVHKRMLMIRDSLTKHYNQTHARPSALIFHIRPYFYYDKCAKYRHISPRRKCFLNADVMFLRNTSAISFYDGCSA